MSLRSNIDSLFMPFKTFNRMFIFATGDRSFHGHPRPLNTTTRTRRSIAMYYYRNGYADHPQETHNGVMYVREKPRRLVCSGTPEHHKSTVFPPCRLFASKEPWCWAKTPVKKPARNWRLGGGARGRGGRKRRGEARASETVRSHLHGHAAHLRNRKGFIQKARP